MGWEHAVTMDTHADRLGDWGVIGTQDSKLFEEISFQRTSGGPA